jgi:tetratricopeptide (TPR) repeat protein
MDDNKLLSLTLGEYKLGEYYSETSFNNFSLSCTKFTSAIELINSLTAFHENIHLLQDIGTGFGCNYSELIRCRNEYVIFSLRKWDQSEAIKIPLINDQNTPSIPKNKRIVDRCRSRYQDYYKTMDILINKRNIEKLLDTVKISSKKSQWTEDAKKIGITDLYEGVPTLFSHYFCIYFGNKYKEFYRQKAHLLPEEYTRTLQFLSNTLFEHYKKDDVKDRLNLLFLLTDLSLHIPPIDYLGECLSQNNDLTDFIPTYRFLQAINAIIDLDLSFPDLSKKDEYLSFVNSICDHPRLKWPGMDLTTDKWITFLTEQSKVAWADNSLKWKISMMNERKENPMLFSTFNEIYSTVLRQMPEFPHFSKTKAGNFVYTKEFSSEWNESSLTVIRKIFLNSIVTQIMESGRIKCTIPKWLVSCDEEKAECYSMLDVNSICNYSRLFESFFELPFSIIQTTVDNHNIISINYEMSIEDIISDLLNNAIKGNDKDMIKCIYELKKNEYFNLLNPTDISCSELLPIFKPDIENGIPKNIKTHIIDARETSDKLFSLGKECEKNNDIDGAIKYYEKLTENYPTEWDGWLNLGLQYLMKEDIDNAIDSYKEALKINPGRYTIWCNLATPFVYCGKYKEALVFLEMSEELCPHDYITLFNAGVCHANLGNKQVAARYFNKAAKNCQDNKMREMCIMNRDMLNRD